MIHFRCAFVALPLFFLFTLPAQAAPAMGAALQVLQQDDGDDGDGDEECSGDDCDTDDDDAKDEDKKKPKIKDIEEFIEDKERFDGLFPFYQDTVTGVIYMEISAAQFGPEFIYHNYVHSGQSGFIGRLSGLRATGDMFDNYIISLRRRFKSVDIIRRDTQFVYEQGSTLENGRRANIPDAVMATVNIVAKDKADTRFIVAVNSTFKGRDLLRIGEAAGIASAIGLPSTKLNKTKTNIQSIRNYPQNAEIVTEYVFDFAKRANPTAVIIQHTLAEMPAPGYVTRQEDPRVGFFTVRRTNLSETEGIPYEDRIRRWRLQKQDPQAAISEPVKPITFWMQNTTPHEYRDTIKAAVLRWNAVFEAAGFRNAITVEVQPEDADWDAGDVRYNVIQWVASPSPLYSGYGPSVVNPRTGEILGANIVIEHNSVRRNKLFDRVFDLSPTALQTESHREFAHASDHDCDHATALLQAQRLAELIALTDDLSAQGANTEALQRIVKDSLTYVVMHEIGHTLGLSHNMKASHYLNVDDLQGSASAEAGVTSGSVMDYPAPNILPNQSAAVPFFPTAPGPYDYWAIGYGYDDRIEDTAYRQAHLGQSGSPGLLFGNDADSMRSSSNGNDPRVMTYDMSSQPIAFAITQMQLLNDTRAKLTSILAEPNMSWDSVARADRVLQMMYRQHVATISRYIGGVYVDRSFVGDDGSLPSVPYVPVEGERQRYAMAMLAEHIFAPDALVPPEGLLPYLQRQRRGQSRTQLPAAHEDIADIQSEALDHLLRGNVMGRIVDSQLYGNEYSINEMLSDLTEAIFAVDLRGPVSTSRQNLQTEYVEQLLSHIEKGSGYSIILSAVYGQVREIDDMMRKNARPKDDATRHHRAYLRKLIENALDENGK